LPRNPSVEIVTLCLRIATGIYVPLAKNLDYHVSSTTRNRFHATEQRFQGQFYGQGTGVIFPVYVVM
jgi:hypothetical protein